MESRLSHETRPTGAATATTSAHPIRTRQGPNLYLHEDIILARVFAQLHTVTSRNTAVLEQIAGLRQDPNAVGLVNFLRAHHVTIECRTTAISLEPDHERPTTVQPTSHSPDREARIPRQRVQQQKE
ncbi:hypothetical protein [Krasilnikovia sp. MM14-A1004]|uniref:hypothetical protein n=1 Tax=Krasilnikovia sp. MM14-A1004 TaxID=3373541 RepID=UPI00399C5576